MLIDVLAGCRRGLHTTGFRVLSRSRPATPASRYRRCQRQTLGLALPVRRMIATVPTRSADRSTILARQTCFCGLFRSAAIAAKRVRSAAESQRQQASRIREI